MIKKGLVLCLLVSTFLVFVQCKEKTITAPLEAETTVMKQNNLVGGWKAIDVTNTVRELAGYVMTENNMKSPINEISNASTQVVSGKNYLFQLGLENGEQWVAQVYLNIHKERTIISFEQISQE